MASPETEAVQIKELVNMETRFESGNGSLTLYEGMPDDVVLKLIKKSLKRAKGAPFTVQQLPDWNEEP